MGARRASDDKSKRPNTSMIGKELRQRPPAKEREYASADQDISQSAAIERENSADRHARRTRSRRVPAGAWTCGRREGRGRYRFGQRRRQSQQIDPRRNARAAEHAEIGRRRQWRKGATRSISNASPISPNWCRTTSPTSAIRARRNPQFAASAPAPARATDRNPTPALSSTMCSISTSASNGPTSWISNRSSCFLGPRE